MLTLPLVRFRGDYIVSLVPLCYAICDKGNFRFFLVCRELYVGVIKKRPADATRGVPTYFGEKV